MGHTLLHQVLVSDLVVPIMLAEAPEHRSLTHFGVRPSGDTWLRPDLVVARREQFRGDRPYVVGVPLLVVEVTSESSLARDLGAKKDLWARIGVPSYWVVRLRGQHPELYVFELTGGRYAERARLGWDGSLGVTEPFELELSMGQVFGRLPRKLTADWRGNMVENPVPGLPPADEEILADVFGARWPTGAEKAELEDGCPVFYGTWDERDVEIAQRTYPGRVVLLDQEPGRPGTLRVLPSGVPPVRPAAEPSAEALTAPGGAEPKHLPMAGFGVREKDRTIIKIAVEGE
ncbi:Uma2 family endonuclease [Actinomadura scrupuli]|uniref:Uma2 family endonuclease n=1 Tax=Actinomadura scrupuli TaxID=559629 RepID=UPI003D981AFE